MEQGIKIREDKSVGGIGGYLLKRESDEFAEAIRFVESQSDASKVAFLLYRDPSSDPLGFIGLAFDRVSWLAESVFNPWKLSEREAIEFLKSLLSAIASGKPGDYGPRDTVYAWALEDQRPYQRDVIYLQAGFRFLRKVIVIDMPEERRIPIRKYLWKRESQKE